jgi:hypothetical protein
MEIALRDRGIENEKRRFIPSPVRKLGASVELVEKVARE